MLNPDAQTLGNHEFDDGPAGLRPYLDAVSWPVLSANTDTSREPRLKDRYKPYTIVVKNGQRIGIVGLTTADTPITSSPGPTVAFGNEAQGLPAALTVAADARGPQGAQRQRDGATVILSWKPATTRPPARTRPSSRPHPALRRWSSRPAPTGPIWACWT